MTSQLESVEPRAALRLPALLLWGALLFSFSGCADSTPPSSRVDPASSAAADQTEAELLLEIERKFENPAAHYELGRLYHRSRQWSKAEYHYNVALGFDPAQRGAQAGMVKMFTDRGETAKAEQYANSYIGGPGMDGMESVRLAWEFERLGLDAQAIRCFRRALALAPASDEVNKQVGFYYLGKGNNAKAKEHLQRSFELNPRQPDVAGALGRLGVVVESPESPPMTMEKQ
jgi:tetratricopeptide (TPR) repeat protein